MSNLRPIKTVEEMAEKITTDGRKNQRLNYKEQSDKHKHEELTRIINEKTEILENISTRGKVDLKNIQEVKIRTVEYLQACASAGVFPSVMGLAVEGYGISRQALNQYLLRNNNDTTDYITMTKDIMADILTNAGLNNNANAVQVLFQLKNHFEHADKVEIQAVSREYDEITTAKLEEKYNSFIDIEE